MCIGPSLLLFPDTYKDTFEALGEQMEDHVVIKRVKPAYCVFFHQREGEGGAVSRPSSLDLSYDVQEMIQQLEQVEKGAGSKYVKWLASSRVALDLGMDAFIKRDFNSPLDFLAALINLIPVLPQINLLDLLLPLYQRLRSRFKDERLIALLSFQVLYVGLSPFNAPSSFSLLTATELTDGVFYPMGGFERVRDLLREIVEEKLGVVIRTSTRVERIDTEATGSGASTDARVTGLTLSGGQVIEADVVISNVDLPLSISLLRDSEQQHPSADLMSKGEFSAGIIAYYWCVKSPLPLLQHHNVFLATTRGSWERSIKPLDLSSKRPNFYLCCPSRTDQRAAPPGCESIMVLLPVANGQEMERAGQTEGYAGMVESGRTAILEALCASGVFEGNVGELRGRIIHEKVLDPKAWGEMYGLAHGAAFGLSHGLNQLAVTRPGQRDPKVKGLYYVGASTRPGNGVPLCMISGKLVANKVVADWV